MPNKNSLIIFTRKPEKGQVKTRLADSIGEEKALEIYNHLLTHSAETTAQVNALKQVWYTNSITKNDLWDEGVFEKHVQAEGNLGFKMQSAFKYNFNQGYKKVVIIGTDLLDINAEIIDEAFELLEQNEVVFGPAEDGGYYLLGMNHFIPQLFQDIEWSTENVLKQSLKQISDKSLALLDEKNDIDYLEDAIKHPELAEIINS